ncbi:MAG: hypothetical protein JO107_14745 [Hyphomicrobiales bacterium]|nr:hypothetical protein [Hyphomicrobiales bacterium]MBV8664348.1 hypothetical protein [Hyphomicrobiales bacterium]
MSDRINEIVERAIEYTGPLLEASPARWSAARRGLKKIHADLNREAPDHPALSRLRAFIARWERSALRLAPAPHAEAARP